MDTYDRATGGVRYSDDAVGTPEQGDDLDESRRRAGGLFRFSAGSSPDFSDLRRRPERRRRREEENRAAEALFSLS